MVHPLICDQKQCFLFFWNLMLLNDQFFPLAQPQKTSTIIRIFMRHERGFTTWRKSCFSHFFLNTRFICAWSNIMLMCVSTHSFSEKKNLFKGLACIIHKSLHCKMFKLEVLHSWCKARNFF